MKLSYYLVVSFLICVLAGGCKKATDSSTASAFVKLFPFDTTYQAAGAFQLADGNFIIYGFPPEQGQLRPLVIKTDPFGNIIWKSHLGTNFHYCTIKPSLTGTNMIAVGVRGDLYTSINICEIDDAGVIIWEKEYQVDSTIKSGPLRPPELEIGAGNDLTIAGTIFVSNGILFPFLMHVSNSIQDSFKIYDTLGYRFMTTGLYKHIDGFTISGCTYIGSAADPTPVETFCLRLDLNYKEVWHTTLTDSVESISSGGISEMESLSNIVLYGSKTINATPNTGATDLVGTLYSQQVDESGNLIESSFTTYSNYPNLGHAAEMSKTSDGGFIVAATTNELSDFHLITDSHLYLLKLDGISLAEQWHNEFMGFNSFTAASVLQTSDGGFLISGYELSSTFHYTMCLIKTDVNGNIISE